MCAFSKDCIAYAIQTLGQKSNSFYLNFVLLEMTKKSTLKNLFYDYKAEAMQTLHRRSNSSVFTWILFCWEWLKEYLGFFWLSLKSFGLKICLSVISLPFKNSEALQRQDQRPHGVFKTMNCWHWCRLSTKCCRIWGTEFRSGTDSIFVTKACNLRWNLPT